MTIHFAKIFYLSAIVKRCHQKKRYQYVHLLIYDVCRMSYYQFLKEIYNQDRLPLINNTILNIIDF